MTEQSHTSESAEVIPFSRGEETLDMNFCRQLDEFLDRHQSHITDDEGIQLFARAEQRARAEMEQKSDQELFAIINRSGPRQWTENLSRYAAVLFELKNRKLVPVDQY